MKKLPLLPYWENRLKNIQKINDDKIIVGECSHFREYYYHNAERNKFRCFRKVAEAYENTDVFPKKIAILKLLDYNETEDYITGKKICQQKHSGINNRYIVVYDSQIYLQYERPFNCESNAMPRAPFTKDFNFYYFDDKFKEMIKIRYLYEKISLILNGILESYKNFQPEQDIKKLQDIKEFILKSAELLRPNILNHFHLQDLECFSLDIDYENMLNQL